MNFPITRHGNKSKDIKLFCQYLPNEEEIETVCEAFAGTFALIRCKYPNVKNLVCADNDTKYTSRLKNIFEDLDGYYIEKKRLNDICNDKTNSNKIMKNEIKKESNKYFELVDFMSGSFGMRKLSEILKYDDLKIIYDKIKWYNDFKKLFNNYKDDKNAFIFLDPPYFASDNKTYYNAEYKNIDGHLTDNTAMYIDILNYFKTCKCKLMMVINKKMIIEYLFKDYIKGEYSKKYGRTQNKEILLVITNY
jgi:hypothetical protein